MLPELLNQKNRSSSLGNSSGNKKGQEDYVVSKEKFNNPILMFYLNQKATFCIVSKKQIFKIINKIIYILQK